MMTGLTVSLGTGNDLNQAETERERDIQVLRGPALVVVLTMISVKTPTPTTQQISHLTSTHFNKYL